jgi:hypothetical protein
MDRYTKFISEQSREAASFVSEKVGTERWHDSNSTTVIHQSGKDKLHGTTVGEDGLDSAIHGHVGGYKIKFKVEGDPYGGRGGSTDISKEHIAKHLYKAHPKLPRDIHNKVVNATHKFMNS